MSVSLRTINNRVEQLDTLQKALRNKLSESSHQGLFFESEATLYKQVMYDLADHITQSKEQLASLNHSPSLA
jgi:hypothetical protein